MYNLGLLKRDARFKYHYLIKDLIEPHFTVVDIGANLGYFSKNFAKLSSSGQLISIEPVRPFYEILQYFIGKKKNVTVHNYALGKEKGSITMVLPESNGMMRTGLPHVAESDEEKKRHKTCEVDIVRGSESLADLSKLDYITCDIEGYEVNVFEEIRSVVEKHLPMVQIEIGPENEAVMKKYFTELGYSQYGVAKFKVVKEVDGKQVEQGDFLFVHKTKAEEFEKKMKSKERFN
jgi:FkbM family methyltransferase